jgi:hypothetical protein
MEQLAVLVKEILVPESDSISATTSDHPSNQVSPKPSFDALQWLPELTTTAISVVILLLASFTLWYTFQTSGGIVTDPSRSRQERTLTAVKRMSCCTRWHYSVR